MPLVDQKNQVADPISLDIPQSWKDFLCSQTLLSLEAALKRLESKNSLPSLHSKDNPFYPGCYEILKAFELCTPQLVKAVILGQDPYHGPGQAHGLAFSVPDKTPLPPSLRNIFKELKSDVGAQVPETGNLTPWAKQGVLLLNSVLTVAPGLPGSHQALGWQEFTDGVIRNLSKRSASVVFILWGSYAQKKTALIDQSKHLVLSSAHPSPLSSYRGFFGSRPFSKTNEFLTQKGLPPIQWSLF